MNQGPGADEGTVRAFRVRPTRLAGDKITCATRQRMALPHQIACPT
jgi:hypothetical protein